MAGGEEGIGFGGNDVEGGGFGGEVDPSEAWDGLARDAAAALLDVRTPEEWASVGAPDLAALGKPLLRASWQLSPDRRLNPAFLEEFDAAWASAAPVAAEGAPAIYVICRSGARSLGAAQAIAASALGRRCRTINVRGGFEGRDGAPGWVSHGLPWMRL